MPKIIRISTIPLSLNVFCKGLFKDLSNDYEVVAISAPGPLLDEIKEREGVKIIGVKMVRHISPLLDLKAMVKLFNVFRKEKPDIVHSMTPKAGLLSMIAAKLAGVPIRVHSFTGLLFPTATGINKIILKGADSMVCACATHVLPEGEGVKNDLIKSRITKKDLQVLGHGNIRGIDLNYYALSDHIRTQGLALRKQWNISEKDFVFVFVGRLVRDKGLCELAKAFDRIAQQHKNTHLILVGIKEKEDPLDNATINLLENNKHIHISTEWVDDVRPYYAAADALVFPSYREGFPNTVLEAGAMELPSIVTDINGSREIIEDGFNGYVVPPHNAEALEEAMYKMMHLPTQELKIFANNAKERIISRFDQRFVRNCLKLFYQQCLKQ